jgi:hypothetical protein
MTGKSPKIWGPPLWPYLHAFARLIDMRCGDHPESRAKMILAFVELLDAMQFVLPCGVCRESFKIMWRSLRLAMKNVLANNNNNCSENSAAFVVYYMHDIVNRKLIKEGHAQSPPFKETLSVAIPTDDDDRIWRYLITMASNYKSNGEHVNIKQQNYMRFCTCLAEFMRTSEMYPRTSSILSRMSDMTGSAITQEDWMDLVYSAYSRWTRNPMSRAELEIRFGICS